jgi:hypothetical protein
MYMENYTPWLLESPPWVQYRTRLDILQEPESSLQVASARMAMLMHPLVKALLAETAGWPGPIVKRHNDANLLLHKMAFLADLGLQSTDPPLEPIFERILNQQSPEGLFQVVTAISTNFGGSGQDQRLWMLCDTPTIIFFLARMGLLTDTCVQAVARTLIGLLRDMAGPVLSHRRRGAFEAQAARTIHARLRR